MSAVPPYVNVSYGVGVPPLFPQAWHPVPLWKWRKRWKGYRWERWMDTRRPPGSPRYVMEYATVVDRAKEILKEEFDDPRGSLESIRR